MDINENSVPCSSNCSPTGTIKKEEKKVSQWLYPIKREFKSSPSPTKKRAKARPKRKSPGKQQRKIDTLLPKLSKTSPLKVSKVKKTKNKITEEPISNDTYLSPSAKLDCKVPKVEDILRGREEYEKFEQIKKLVEKSSARFLKGLQEKKDYVKSPKKPVKIIDCKHLTIEEITQKFHKDIKFLDDIFYGVTYNERHELFKVDTPLNNFTKNDLRVNESTAAFTEDQLVHIVSLFRDRYDHGNRYKYSDYYFKVLLPEYCLKIFMDIYEMDNKEALDYLKSVPVPDYLGVT